MESARLRLIILGALRGFIKPGYEYGINSVIREELLTRALSREIDGEAFMNRGLMEAAIVPVVEGMRRPQAYRRAMGYILQANAMMKLQPHQDVKDIHLTDNDKQQIQKTIALLKVLKRTDFSDKMLAMLKAA